MEVSGLKAQFWIPIRTGMESGSGPGSALNPLLFRLEETRSMKAKMAPKTRKSTESNEIESFEPIQTLY